MGLSVKIMVAKCGELWQGGLDHCFGEGREYSEWGKQRIRQWGEIGLGVGSQYSEWGKAANKAVGEIGLGKRDLGSLVGMM